MVWFLRKCYGGFGILEMLCVVGDFGRFVVLWWVSGALAFWGMGFVLPFWGEVWYNGEDMVGLAQMVRASDCGPEGRWFDPSIPPHVV